MTYPDRAAGDDPHGDRRHRRLAGDQEQCSGPVAIRVEIGEFVALASRVAGGQRFARSHRAGFDAREMRGVMGEAAGRLEFAVADAIDPGLDLLPHRFRNAWRDLCCDGRGVG
jgi:hypothetical protein